MDPAGDVCADCAGGDDRWREASRGGERGYKTPAYELCRHLASPCPNGVDDEEWAAEVDRLGELVMPTDPDKPIRLALHRRDAAAVLAWFDRHLPRCMALVPRRRRQEFVVGVYECADDENFGWEQ